ncbi:serine carboxypeptidase-like 45 [Dorcoceras hygrometricum]|uniref:Serine carboxypeptidase-like 45 n=1 Tax=Dorcoceras hygrometricum TaxID=472368 RepID=A0A2Z7CFJ4_9LAMI|nr:serine carboxypeptidase-like 45 [Dorcoceras hygrometricum]
MFDDVRPVLPEFSRMFFRLRADFYFQSACELISLSSPLAIWFPYSVAHDLDVRSELTLFDQIVQSWFSVMNQYARVLIILRADPA